MRNNDTERVQWRASLSNHQGLTFLPVIFTMSSTSLPSRSFFRKKGHVAWRRTKNVAVQWEVAATLHTLSSPAPLFALNSSWRHIISTGTAYNILPLRKSGWREKVNITRWNSEPRLLRKPFEILHVCCFCQSDPMCSILMNYPSGCTHIAYHICTCCAEAPPTGSFDNMRDELCLGLESVSPTMVKA